MIDQYDYEFGVVFESYSRALQPIKWMRSQYPNLVHFVDWNGQLIRGCNGVMLHMRIKDSQVAMMFRLTWG